MKAFTQLKSFEGRGSMEGWLARIATNTCLDTNQKCQNRQPEATVVDLTDDENERIGWMRSFRTLVEPRHSVEQTLIAAECSQSGTQCFVS